VKHNKKRNTAFLYNVLVKELTKSIVSKNNSQRKAIVLMLKEHFARDTVLGRELECYRTLLETTGLELHVAEKLLFETKTTRLKLGGKKIFDGQTEVINKINTTLPKESWNNFMPNFKSLATISTIFNDDASPKKRVLYEDSVIKLMGSAADQESNVMQPIDNIIYQSFVKKYNKKYVDLLKEQKDLLGKYISSVSGDKLELKLYLNEEVGRLKKIIKKSLKLEEVYTDEKMVEKTKKVLNILEGYKETASSREMVFTVLKVQQLVREIQTDD